MKSFTALPEFRYALLLALAAGGWVLIYNVWRYKAVETDRPGWEGEASFIIVIPAYFLFVCTCLGAFAYFSHAWQRWRDPTYPPAGKVPFVLLFSPAALTFPIWCLSLLTSLFNR